jgi:hypothetical protein
MESIHDASHDRIDLRVQPVERAVDKLNEVARAIQERQGAEFASILDP